MEKDNRANRDSPETRARARVSPSYSYLYPSLFNLFVGFA